MMKSIELLNNVQKARLLHDLFIQEIPQFLGYLHELTDGILNDKEKIIEQWQSPMLGAGFWFELAETVQTALIEKTTQLTKSRDVFAEELFSGYTAIYTVHGLMKYRAHDNSAHHKFKLAIQLLFT